MTTGAGHGGASAGPPVVVVVGSINADLTARVGAFPRPGETVVADELTCSWGGKGANQAVAAARAGARVVLFGCVGSDHLGLAALADLRASGVDTTGVQRVAGPTGQAMIVVDAGGENTIVVASGANASVTGPSDQEVAPAATGVVLSGFEVPDAAVVAAARAAERWGWWFVCNPAPARPLPVELVLGPRTVLTPNEREAEALGVSVADIPRSTGAVVVVTRGAAGVLVIDRSGSTRFDAPLVSAVVDSTGAGDVFNGVLAAQLAMGQSLTDSVVHAIDAASAAVTRPHAR